MECRGGSRRPSQRWVAKASRTDLAYCGGSGWKDAYVFMKSRSRRIFGGRLGERGSVLVYAVVLFGLCAVILAGSVSKESSARTLNIQTGQRRKALDVARGGVDEMLMALYQKDFDLAKCPGYSAGVSSITREDPPEGWTLSVTAREEAASSILVEGHATVRQVSETVRVWLEPYSLQDIFSDGAIVAGGNAQAQFNPNAVGCQVEGNVRVGGTWTLTEKNQDQFTVENGNVVAGVPVSVPEPKQIKAAVQAMVDARDSWPGTVEDKEHIVISSDTKTGNLNVTGSSLTVEEDTWLYVDGKFNGNGKIQSVTVNGVMVVTGEMNFNTNKNVPISVSGTGMIVCLADKKSKITLSAGSWGGITLVCTGELDLSFANAPEPKPGGNSLLVYGGTLGVTFTSESPIELNPCRLLSPGNMQLNFENKAKLVGLHAGEIHDPGGQTITIGYRVSQWKEGKGS